MLNFTQKINGHSH